MGSWSQLESRQKTGPISSRKTPFPIGYTVCQTSTVSWAPSVQIQEPVWGVGWALHIQNNRDREDWREKVKVGKEGLGKTEGPEGELM